MAIRDSVQGTSGGPDHTHAIEVPDGILGNLRARIDATRWPDPAPGEPWEQGTDPAYLRDLLRDWAHDFDWRAREEEVNAFSHFHAEPELVAGDIGAFFGRLGLERPTELVGHCTHG